MKEKKRIVIKVGTSTLTYENGKLNIRHLEKLCKVISDLQNQGNEMVLVSSGALGVGMGKLGMRTRPSETNKKQAVAAVGQCELMFMYDKLFGEYNNIVAQILLTKYAVETPEKAETIHNAFISLIDMGIIPVVNENDSVATDEIEGNNFGDNDQLSAIVATLISADKLIILTDIDGLYDKNPALFSDAKKINTVELITDEIKKMAGGRGSNRGTGGMTTKVLAAEIATKEGIDVQIISGENPELIYDIFDEKPIGTLFLGKVKDNDSN
ncbi:MAG: glutamate 5-kinase [Oscillospiraceae bacterium]|nr:glutamate 5-kinase [Oscillospiraceae bacterium]